MKPLLLCILDGVGIRKNIHGNALYAAKTPNLNKLFSEYPHTTLEASGPYVGLPKDQMGNSEVGHINIGTGRVPKQSIDIINNALENCEIESNNEYKNLIKHIKKNNSNLHICGLLSDGGIHSHINHLLRLIDILKKENINHVYYHIFTDGRDTTPHEALKFIKVLQNKIDETEVGKIATISGRYYAMDRDNRWDRIKKAYDVMTKKTKIYNINDKINESYKNGITDEFIEPFAACDGIIKENDGILVFNFRPDRLRELFTALSNPNFKEFEREYIQNLKMVTMMPVDSNVICQNLFTHPKITNYLGAILEKNHLKQLRIAETEKYAHVTYFFDGENKDKLNECDQVLIPSPKVATYDLKPEMSAYEITETLLSKIENYDVIILNFANGDMVGHTGNFKATVKAIETVDQCVGKIYQKIEELKGTLIITADHGNCDYMLDDENNIITSHSVNPVPFLITNKKLKLKTGKLADIAPTMLTILNIKVPKEMTGDILIVK